MTHNSNRQQITLEAWLQRNTQVSRTALAAAGVDAQGAGDAFLDDPAKLVEVAEATVEAAKQESAPETVLQELQATADRLRDGLANLERYDYTRQQLQQLRAVTSEARMISALERAVADAPDAANRTKLETMVTIGRAKQERRQAPDALRMNWGCCVFVSALCFASGGGVVVCCAVALLLC